MNWYGLAGLAMMAVSAAFTLVVIWLLLVFFIASFG